MKMLMTMMMMLVMSAAVAEEFDITELGEPVPPPEEEWWECDECFGTWELVFVFEDEMYDMPGTFASRERCLDYAVEFYQQASSSRSGQLLGFICEEPKEATPKPRWELKMVNVDGVMVEVGRHYTWAECTGSGVSRVNHQLSSNGSPDNSFRWLGFQCREDQKPEPVSKLVPKCLQPMKECV